MLVMADAPEDRIELKQAESRYGVPYHTLRTWIRRGKIRSWKQGRGRIAVSCGDIEEMLRFRPK